MKSFAENFDNRQLSDEIGKVYDSCVQRIHDAKTAVLSRIEKVGREQCVRSVPPLREFISGYVKGVAEAEAEMNVKYTCNWPTSDLDELRNLARKEIKSESASTMTALSDEYRKVYGKIAVEVLDAAKSHFNSLLEEMKGRDLTQDVSEKEFDHVDEAIRDDFERNYLCAADKDLHWQHLINGPLIKLHSSMKDKARKEIIQPHNVARRTASAINANSEWKPDPILITKEIEKSVETLKEAISYMSNALLRRGKCLQPALFRGCTRAASDDENLYFIVLEQMMRTNMALYLRQPRPLPALYPLPPSLTPLTPLFSLLSLSLFIPFRG